MAGRGKAAKMSMKDILFLFKRDAEGNYRDREGEELNRKTRILKERRAVPPPPETTGGRYLSPQEIAEQEARRAREAASAYGRR
jgi:hypothetical protein